MSTVYVLEPPTRGKVVVKTTHGPLDIELWPKEAPKAVRNFLQLCMEGYYDNNIFHRIIKSFLIQTGDPTATGQGGESIYGAVFPDEFHSRLRFKHRGLVACAGNGESPNSNASQFFITLDRCEWLDKKHTIFGKVTGDSIYNLLQLGEIDTNEITNRPFDPPPKILSVEILWNPFDDIVPRIAADKSLPVETGKGVVREKATKKLNLLSFGEEAEEEEKELADVKIKIKSSHDVLNDPRLLKEETQKNDMELPEGKKNRDVQLNVREALSSKKEEARKKTEAGFPESLDYSDDDEASFDVRMRQQILRKRQEHGDLPDKPKSKGDRASLKNRAASPPKSSVGTHEEKAKAEKLSLKKKGIGSKARAERMANTDADLQLLGEAEKERHLLKQKRRRRQGQEEEALAKLEQFKSFLDAKPKTSSGTNAASKGEDLSDWKTVKLQFAPEPGKDNMTRSNDPNDYVVHDPLLEEGKQKFNKMLAKQKQRGREWAGKSLT